MTKWVIQHTINNYPGNRRAMINSAAEAIGKQLRDIREDRGLSLRQAGKELGVTHQTIDNCEKGKRLPQLTLLIAAIAKWNVSLS